jgi:sugar phosphate isomerase/epimerase
MPRDTMLTRREVTGILTAVAVPRLRAAVQIPVAIQLFSLRKQCEADLERTLAFVRDTGFDGVEFAGYYGRTAAQLRGLLDKHSLKCCGSHTPLPELTGDRLRAAIEDNQTLRNRNLIIPGLPKQYITSAAGWTAAAEQLNQIAENLRPVNMRVGYHNHDAEFRFVDGILPWALLFERTHPDVILQLDTGNARVAGANPTALVHQYPGRAVTVHIKDYLPLHPDPVLGSSGFDWKQFLRACTSRGGTEWFVIEHDSPRREEAKLCFDRFKNFLSAAQASTLGPHDSKT